MREKERIDRILSKIKILWEQNPDWRLGQLIVNVSKRDDPFYFEDTLLEKELDKYLDNLG